MATSWIFSPHSPTIQLVSLLLQLLSPLTFQEWPDIGLRFPSRKYSFAKAQKQVMLGNLENMIIFKESGRPSKASISPSFCCCSWPGRHWQSPNSLLISPFVERWFGFPNKKSNQEGFRVMWREGDWREGQAFSSRTLAQGQSAKLTARLADSASGSQSDKKVIRITCHFPLRQVWEPKWKQFLGGKLFFALPLTLRSILLGPSHLMDWLTSSIGKAKSPYPRIWAGLRGCSKTNWMRILAATDRGNAKNRKENFHWLREKPNRVRKSLELPSDNFEAPES